MFVQNQIYPAPENDNMPRYTNSYDTTVARESWSLSNEQNLSRDMEHLPIIPLKLYVECFVHVYS